MKLIEKKQINFIWVVLKIWKKRSVENGRFEGSWKDPLRMIVLKRSVEVEVEVGEKIERLEKIDRGQYPHAK